jgi:GAF domain-containing protein
MLFSARAEPLSQRNWNGSGEQPIVLVQVKGAQLMASLIGPHEQDRLRVLTEAGIVAAPLEPALERICEEARQHFEVAISLITLVERQRLMVKAACGIDVTEMPRDGAFCAYTILADEVFVIPDMSADERFRHTPWVTGEPHARFYAGKPPIYQENVRLGSLCVLDTQPRSFSRGDKAELREMADRAVSVMATQEIEALMQASRRRPM